MRYFWERGAASQKQWQLFPMQIHENWHKLFFSFCFSQRKSERSVHANTASSIKQEINKHTHTLTHIHTHTHARTHIHTHTHTHRHTHTHTHTIALCQALPHHGGVLSGGGNGDPCGPGLCSLPAQAGEHATSPVHIHTFYLSISLPFFIHGRKQ